MVKELVREEWRERHEERGSSFKGICKSSEIITPRRQSDEFPWCVYLRSHPSLITTDGRKQASLFCGFQINRIFKCRSRFYYIFDSRLVYRHKVDILGIVLSLSLSLSLFPSLPRSWSLFHCLSFAVSFWSKNHLVRRGRLKSINLLCRNIRSRWLGNCRLRCLFWNSFRVDG